MHKITMLWGLSKYSEKVRFSQGLYKTFSLRKRKYIQGAGSNLGNNKCALENNGRRDRKRDLRNRWRTRSFEIVFLASTVDGYVYRSVKHGLLNTLYTYSES